MKEPKNRWGAKESVALVALCAAGMLPGCATSYLKQVDKIHNQERKAARTHMPDADSSQILEKTDDLYVSDRMYGYRLRHREDLPYNKTVTLNLPQRQNMGEVAAWITRLTGIPVRFSQTITGGTSAETQAPRTGPDAPTPDPNAQISAGSNHFASGLMGRKVSLAWTGSLRGLLDDVTGQAGMFWKYQDGTIRFFVSESRTWHIPLPIGLKNLSSFITVSSGAGGSSSSGGGMSGGGLSGGGMSGGGMSGGGMSGAAGGSSGGGAQGTTGSNSFSISTMANFDYFQGILSSVQSILIAHGGTSQGNSGGAQSSSGGASAGGGASPSSSGGGASAGGSSAGGSTGGGPTYGGGQVSLDIASRTLTVASTPEAIEAVSKYIRKIKREGTKNIVVNLKVYKLTIQDAQNAGFSTQLFLQSLGSAVGVTSPGITLPQAQGGASSTASLIIPPSSMGSGQVSSNASQIALGLMNSYGNVSVVTSGSLLTTNGIPAPFQDASQISYLAESGSTLAANAGSQQMSIPGQITVGFTANVIPELMKNDKIMLQFQMQLSTLVGMPSLNTAGSIIQLPNVAYQTMDQQAVMKNGSTIVLAGYEQNNTQYNDQQGAAGVAAGGQKTRTVLVILLSASRVRI